MFHDENHTREEVVRAEFSKEEVVRRISEIYHAQYDPSCGLDAWDQLLACEAIAESTQARDYPPIDSNPTNESASVSGVFSGTCKRQPTFELTPRKLEILGKLERCNYRTPPIEVSRLLETLFEEWPSNEGHWLYIAQNYAPRVVNWNLAEMVKLHTSGRKTFLNPPGYFTKTIQYRKKRGNGHQ